mgnify:CR=1 FL=1
MSEHVDPDPASPEAIAGAELLYAGGLGSLALDGKELGVWKRADGRCVLRETSAHDGDTRHRSAWLTEEQARAEIEAFKAASLAAEKERLVREAAQAATAGDTATFVGAILGLIVFLALVAWVIASRS